MENGSDNDDAYALIGEVRSARFADIQTFALKQETLLIDCAKLTRIDFIKADIEGAERNLLRGAQEILKTFAPKLALCAYHLPDDPKVLRDLILRANPDYVVTERFKKLYARIPRRPPSDAGAAAPTRGNPGNAR